MRITTNMIYDRNLASMSKVSERQNTAYNQLMTGDKFSRSGEDPAGMSQKMALTKEIDLFKQYGVNGSLLENSLGHEETVLTSLNSAMLSAQTLIQKANNSAMGSEERSAIASELEGLQKQMFDLMNSKNSQGEYIFGGNQSKTQPFVKDASGNYVFQGDTGQRNIQVSPTVQIPANDSGFDLFEIVATQNFVLDTPKNDNILNGMSDFISAMRDPTLSESDFQLAVSDATTHMSNARTKIDRGLGELGGRMNSLEQVMSSNDGLSTLTQQARAKVSEADMYEVIAALSKEDAAMSASQLAFSKISKLTLFDYIR